MPNEKLIKNSKIKPGPIRKLQAIKRAMNSDGSNDRHHNNPKHMYLNS
jgi:hypothetical protein